MKNLKELISSESGQSTFFVSYMILAVLLLVVVAIISIFFSYVLHGYSNVSI